MVFWSIYHDQKRFTFLCFYNLFISLKSGKDFWSFYPIWLDHFNFGHSSKLNKKRFCAILNKKNLKYLRNLASPICRNPSSKHIKSGILNTAKYWRESIEQIHSEINYTFNINLRWLFRAFVLRWRDKINPCLKYVRILLEIWKLVCKYTHVCSFRKYTF